MTVLSMQKPGPGSPTFNVVQCTSVWSLCPSGASAYFSTNGW